MLGVPLAWITKQIRDLAGTRWIVVLGLGVAALTFVGELIIVKGTVIAAVFLAFGAHASVLALAGISRQIWKGAEVTDAQLPGGAGLGVETVQNVQDALEGLNERVDAQMHDLNRRMYDVEKAVFDGPDERNDETE